MSGTNVLNSLRLETWGKCIESETYAAFPGLFVSQLENATQEGVSNMGQTVLGENEEENLTGVSGNQTYIEKAEVGKE